MWGKLPYAKKWSTPTTPQETEGALTLGYWLGKQLQEPTSICERHRKILEISVTTFLREGSREPEPPAQPTFNPALQPLMNENSMREQPPELISVDLAAPYRQGGQHSQQDELTEPYRRILETQQRVAAEEANTTKAQPLLHIAKPEESKAQPGTVQGAIEAAKAPPTEGAKIMMNCPLCGEQFLTGQVHAC